MKSIILFTISTSMLLLSSCERHSFEGPNGTKQLHHHHDHADHDAKAHHGSSAEH